MTAMLLTTWWWLVQAAQAVQGTTVTLDLSALVQVLFGSAILLGGRSVVATQRELVTGQARLEEQFKAMKEDVDRLLGNEQPGD